MATDRSDVALVLGVVGLVPAIYGAATPSLSSVRAETDERGTTAYGVAAATLMSGGVVLAVAYAMRSWAVLTYGLGMVVAYSYVYETSRQAAV